MNKTITFLVTLLLIAFASQAQSDEDIHPHKASFELGSGLQFDLNDGAYRFKISGMMQPYVGIEKTEGETEYFFNSKRTFFSIGGKAKEEKVDFFVQLDFSQARPLLDAFVKFKPYDFLNISFGQKQNIANNREMLIFANDLQFAERSLLSRTFSGSGREFGLFLNTPFTLGKIFLEPQVSVTSGDGRNSFGADSRDVDLGGFKYSGRLDIMPFGKFSTDDKSIADFTHEKKPKVLLGVAASYNDGVSNGVGEGHGDIYLYNALGEFQLPDYRQIYSDVVIKYQGFSLLAEYSIATATGLDNAYVNETSTVALVPTQISELLALGRSYNIQAGFVSKAGIGFDVRYTQLLPEFDENVNAIVQTTEAYTFGLTKYFKENNNKINAAVSQYNIDSNQESWIFDIMWQLMF